MEQNLEAEPFNAVLFRVEHWQNDGGKFHFYPKNEFYNRRTKFDELNVVYARRHPDKGFRGRTLADVLKEVNGTKVGYTSQSRIDNQRPEFASILNITDPATATKIRNNELAISTGIWYDGPDVGYLENVSGDHVLLYDKSLGIPQGDAGALILNQQSTNENEKTTTYYSRILGFFGAENMPDNDPIKEVNPVEQFLIQNQATLIKTEAVVLKQADEIKEKEKLILNQAAEYKILSEKLAAIETEKLINLQENTWNGFLEGTRTKFEARKGELGELGTSLKLAQDMRDHEKTLDKFDPQTPEGTQNLQNNQGKTDAEKEEIEAIAALKKIKSIVGR